MLAAEEIGVVLFFFAQGLKIALDFAGVTDTPIFVAFCRLAADVDATAVIDDGGAGVAATGRRNVEDTTAVSYCFFKSLSDGILNECNMIAFCFLLELYISKGEVSEMVR